jgi:hypothetical protein
MPTAEARVATDRADRYLAQLCGHLSRMSGMRHRPPTRHADGQPHDDGHRPPQVEHVDHSDTYGSIRFAGGLCTLHATSDALALHIDADDEDTLLRLQNGITGRLEKIGRRDQLTVTWRRPDEPEDPPGEAAGPIPASATGPARSRGHSKAIAMTVVGALVVAGHLGIFGAALAASAWTEWGVNAVLAIVLLKVVFMGGHVVLARFAIRRGKTVRLPWIQRHRRLASPAATSPAAETATINE